MSWGLYSDNQKLSRAATLFLQVCLGLWKATNISKELQSEAAFVALKITDLAVPYGNWTFTIKIL